MLYPKTDGWYDLDDAGIETKIGSSGSGEINLITDSSAASNWSSTGTIAIATTADSSELPLAGAINTAILISGGAANDYARYRFTMSESLKQTMLKIEWFQRALASFANDDFKVELHTNTDSDYSGSYTEVPLNTDVSGDTNLKNEDGVFRSSFFSQDQDYYELRIVRVAGTSALSIANVIVGPGKNALGAVVTPFYQQPTPSGGWFVTGPTNVDTTVWVQRDGECANFRYRIVATGTSAAFSEIIAKLPDGMTANSDTIKTGTFGSYLGNGNMFKSGGGNYEIEAHTTTALNQIRIYYRSSESVVSLLTNASPAAWNTTGSANILEVTLNKVPIAEWAGSGTLNTGENDVEYAASTTGTWDAAAAAANTIYGPEGAPITGNLTAIRTKEVRLRTAIQPTDTLDLEVLLGSKWISVPATFAYQNQGSFSYGGRITASGAQPITDVTVIFGQYLTSTGASYATAGAQWGALTNARWRVVKRKAGTAVGFGLAKANTPGLVSQETQSITTVTATTGGAIAVSFEIRLYKVGKKVSAYFFSLSATASASPSITVPAGTIPPQFRPQNVGTCHAGVRNATVLISGWANIQPDGGMLIRKYDGSNFTGTCNVESSFASWLIE
jgi:hypothetical protein